MNLQESIRRILREEKEIPPYLRRRLYIADEYMDDLNADSLHDGWVMDQIDDFVRACMGAITRMIISKTSKNRMGEDGYMRMYDEIYGFLIKLGYQKRLFKFFYDVMMDRWVQSPANKEDLNEEDISNKYNEEIPKYLKRRLNIVDEYIDNLNPDVIQHFNQREDYVVSTINTIITIILDGVNIITNNPADSNNEGGGITAYEYMALRDKTLDHLKRLGYVRKLINFFDDTIINRDKENLLEYEIGESNLSDNDDDKIPQYLRRRYYIVDKYYSELDPVVICLGDWTMDDRWVYVNNVMSGVIQEIIEDLPVESPYKHEVLYERIYKDLERIKYKDKVFNFFYWTMLDCGKGNLTEEKGSYEDSEVDVPQYLKRRLYIADELMEQLNTPRRINYICEYSSFQFGNFEAISEWYGRDMIDEITKKIVDSIREDLKKTKGVDLFDIFLDSNRRYSNLYDKIFQTLVDLGYKQKTIDFFTKTALECKNHNI